MHFGACTGAGERDSEAAEIDGVPGDPDHPSSNRIHIGSDDGALGIVELHCAGERVTKLSIGHWRYSAEFEGIRSGNRTATGVFGGHAALTQSEAHR